jgi:hypothetical protein
MFCHSTVQIATFRISRYILENLICRWCSSLDTPSSQKNRTIINEDNFFLVYVLLNSTFGHHVSKYF